MKKKVALISSFCDSDDKINVLNENIKKLKAFNLDIILATPIYLPDDVIKLCDYVFYTKENLMLEWPLYREGYWKEICEIEGNIVILWEVHSHYGWAGLSQVKKLTEIALTFDYEYFYHLIYDLEINRDVLNVLNEEPSNLIAPFKRGNVELNSSLHLMAFNRENVKKLNDHISLENYLEFLKIPKDRSAEAFLEKIKSSMKSETTDFFVSDKIHILYKNFNHSEVDDLMFFIEKDTRNDLPEIRIFFYKNNNALDVKVSINDNLTKIDLSRNSIFSSGVNIFELESAYILLNNKKIDLLDKIKSIKYSEIQLKKVV
jgi:hypothetical protein